MATKKQIAANRRNSKRCTGPKTEAGKAVCSLNALRHGFYSSAILLPGENQDQFDDIRGGLADLYRPQDDHQQQLIDSLTAIKWKMRRAELFEAGILTEFADQPVSLLLPYYDRITQIHGRLLRAWLKLVKELESIRTTRLRLAPAASANTSSKCCAPESPRHTPPAVQNTIDSLPGPIPITISETNTT